MNFTLKDQDNNLVSLTQFKGKKVVLYCYPKADTPGCTVQACGIRDNIGAIKRAGAVVIGLSPDEPDDLDAFHEKFDLNFTLLADPETKVLQQLGVWKEKNFMGHKYMGVERTTFLLDENGDIIKTYEKVNPVTHVDMILADLRVGKPVIEKTEKAPKPKKTKEVGRKI